MSTGNLIALEDDFSSVPQPKAKGSSPSLLGLLGMGSKPKGPTDLELATVEKPAGTWRRGSSIACLHALLDLSHATSCVMSCHGSCLACCVCSNPAQCAAQHFFVHAYGD